MTRRQNMRPRSASSHRSVETAKTTTSRNRRRTDCRDESQSHSFRRNGEDSAHRPIKAATAATTCQHNTRSTSASSRRRSLEARKASSSTGNRVRATSDYDNDDPLTNSGRSGPSHSMHRNGGHVLAKQLDETSRGERFSSGVVRHATQKQPRQQHRPPQRQPQKQRDKVDYVLVKEPDRKQRHQSRTCEKESNETIAKGLKKHENDINLLTATRSGELSAPQKAAFSHSMDAIHSRRNQQGRTVTSTADSVHSRDKVDYVLTKDLDAMSKGNRFSRSVRRTPPPQKQQQYQHHRQPPQRHRQAQESDKGSPSRQLTDTTIKSTSKHERDVSFSMRSGGCSPVSQDGALSGGDHNPSSKAASLGVAHDSAASKREQVTHQKILNALQAAGVGLGASSRVLENLGLSEEYVDGTKGGGEDNIVSGASVHSFHDLNGTYVIGDNTISDVTMEMTEDNEGVVKGEEECIDKKRGRGGLCETHYATSAKENMTSKDEEYIKKGQGNMFSRSENNLMDVEAIRTSPELRPSIVRYELVRSLPDFSPLAQKDGEHNIVDEEGEARMKSASDIRSRYDPISSKKGSFRSLTDGCSSKQRRRSDRNIDDEGDVAAMGSSHVVSGSRRHPISTKKTLPSVIPPQSIEVKIVPTRDDLPPPPLVAHRDQGVRSLLNNMVAGEGEIEIGSTAEVPGSIRCPAFTKKTARYLAPPPRSLGADVVETTKDIIPPPAHHVHFHSSANELSPRQHFGDLDVDHAGDVAQRSSADIPDSVAYLTSTTKGTQSTFPPPPPRRPIREIDSVNPPPCRPHLPNNLPKISQSHSSDDLDLQRTRANIASNKGDSVSKLRSLAMELGGNNGIPQYEKNEYDDVRKNEEWNHSQIFGRVNSSKNSTENNNTGLPSFQRSCSAFTPVKQRTLSSEDEFSSFHQNLDIRQTSSVDSREGLLDVHQYSKSSSPTTDIDATALALVADAWEIERDVNRHVTKALDTLRDLQAVGVDLDISQNKLKDLLLHTEEDREGELMGDSISNNSDDSEEDAESSAGTEDCSVFTEEGPTIDGFGNLVSIHIDDSDGSCHSTNDMSEITMQVIQNSDVMAGEDEYRTDKKTTNNVFKSKNFNIHARGMVRRAKFDAADNHMKEGKVAQPTPEPPPSLAHYKGNESLPYNVPPRQHHVDDTDGGGTTVGSLSGVTGSIRCPTSDKKGSTSAIPPPPPRRPCRDLYVADCDSKKNVHGDEVKSTHAIVEPPVSQCIDAIWPHEEDAEGTGSTAPTTLASETQTTEEEDDSLSLPLFSDEFLMNQLAYDGNTRSSGNNGDLSFFSNDKKDAESPLQVNDSVSRNGSSSKRSRKQRIISESLLRNTNGGISLSSVPEWSTECKNIYSNEAHTEGILNLAAVHPRPKQNLTSKKNPHKEKKKQDQQQHRQKKHTIVPNTIGLQNNCGSSTPLTSPLDRKITSPYRKNVPLHLPPPPFQPPPPPSHPRKPPSQHAASSSLDEDNQGPDFNRVTIGKIDGSANQPTPKLRRRNQHPRREYPGRRSGGTHTVNINSSSSNAPKSIKFNHSTSSSNTNLPPPPPRRKPSFGNESVSGTLTSGSVYTSTTSSSNLSNPILAASLGAASPYISKPASIVSSNIGGVGSTMGRRDRIGDVHQESSSRRRRGKSGPSIHQEKKSGNASISEGDIAGRVEN